MFDDVRVTNVQRKLITVSGQKYLCDIISMGDYALCKGENLETGEKTECVTIHDKVNPALSFGEYLKENY